jgi:hypothetical protein
MDKKFLIIIVDFLPKKPTIIIQHNNIQRTIKEKVVKIFKNKFFWDGKQNHSMILKV